MLIFRLHINPLEMRAFKFTALRPVLIQVNFSLGYLAKNYFVYSFLRLMLNSLLMRQNFVKFDFAIWT